MMKCVRIALSVLAIVTGLCAKAKAEPYDIVARYQIVSDKGSDTTDVSLLNSSTKALPIRALNGAFQGIFIKGPKDVLSRTLLGETDIVVIKISAPNNSLIVPPIQFNTSVLQSGEKAEKGLLVPEQLAGNQAQALTIQVNLHYTDDHLCERELQYRLDKGEDRTQSEKPPQLRELSEEDAKKRATETLSGKKYDAYAWFLLVKHALVADDGKVIYETFCSKAHPEIDEEHLRFRGKVGADAHALYKDAFVSKLQDVLKLDDNTVYEKLRSSELRPNIYARSEYVAPVLFDNSAFDFKEVDESGPRDLGTVLDKNSTLNVGIIAATEIPNCPQVIGSAWSARLDYENDKKTTETASLVPEGRYWRIDSKFADHVGEPVTITILQKVGSAIIEIVKRRTVVQDLGLITTFPVVTDVLSAISKNPKTVKDLTSQSSIPVSWAIDLANGDRSMAAITFPWMLGWNSRGAPELAKYLKIYPHVSIVVPLSQSNNTATPIVAVGGGIAVASAFTFSLGATVTEDTSHALLLIGISVTDIAKVISP